MLIQSMQLTLSIFFLIRLVRVQFVFELKHFTLISELLSIFHHLASEHRQMFSTSFFISPFGHHCVRYTEIEILPPRQTQILLT